MRLELVDVELTVDTRGDWLLILVELRTRFERRSTKGAFSRAWLRVNISGILYLLWQPHSIFEVEINKLSLYLNCIKGFLYIGFRMNVSDADLIHVLNKIQEDLSRLVEDMNTILSYNTQCDNKKVKQKKANAEKSPAEKSPAEKSNKTSGLLIWNSFLNIVKNEMESDGSEVKYGDLIKKAVEMKKGDPEGYKLFSETWTHAD